MSTSYVLCSLANHTCKVDRWVLRQLPQLLAGRMLLVLLLSVTGRVCVSSFRQDGASEDSLDYGLLEEAAEGAGFLSGGRGLCTNPRGSGTCGY